MSVLGLLLAVVSVAQGDALRIEYPHEAGLRSVSIDWRNRPVPFVRSGDAWFTLVGVDLETGAGSYPATVTFRYEDGRTTRRDEVVEVTAKEFPTTRLTVEPQYVELSAEDLERSNRESARLGEIFGRVSGEIPWTEPFDVPIPGSEGSNFGHRRVFNDEARNPHSGADIAASEGTPIRSANRGRVVETGNYFFNGNTVVVDHGLGIYAVYLHLSRIDVEIGQIVERGEVLGLVGATGRVTGPHLHWGFRVQNARVDPFSLVRVSN